MSKIHHRKFARFFPAYHPRAGEPTYFVEKLWESIGFSNCIEHEGMFNTIHSLSGYNEDFIQTFFSSLELGVRDQKHHTIRAGHHVKPGDFIRPSVWSGKPYASKQIIIGPDIEVVKTWDFELTFDDLFYVNNELYAYSSSHDALVELTKNDGLEINDFLSWFNKPFTGQIICWNKSIEY